MSNKQLRFIYGKMLTQVCEKVGLKPTHGNKEAVKAMLKTFSGIETLGRMDGDDDFTYNVRLSRFITHSAILLASEAGIVIDFPGEHDAEQQDMRNFLKLIYHDGRSEKATEDSSTQDEIHEEAVGRIRGGLQPQDLH